MKLINGRGQLGEALQGKNLEATIYHTWNVYDRSEEAQRKCYEDFCKYVDEHDEWIVFISTHSRKKNWYVKYKRLAEKYLKNGIYVRLPILIGKGPCENLLSGKSYGIMEIITIEDAIKQILKAKKSLTIKGTRISAKTVQSLLHYGLQHKIQ